MTTETTMKKTSETYYETIGAEVLTIKVNLEAKPVMYMIVDAPRCWRTKASWLAWLDVCRDRIERMP